MVGLALAGADRPLRQFLLRHPVVEQFRPELSDTYTFEKRNVSAGEQVAAGTGTDTAKTCGSSGIAQSGRRPDRFQRQPECLDLVDDPLQARPVRHRLGQHAVDGQQGVVPAWHQPGGAAARRPSSPTISAACARPRRSMPTCRMRAAICSSTNTPGISASARSARRRRRRAIYRDAVAQAALLQRPACQACQATFDARADNLKQYIDRIAATSARPRRILKERAENHNNGWFDTRADDRFWFAYGQLYAYYGLMKGAAGRLRGRHQGKAPAESVGHDGRAVRARRCASSPSSSPTAARMAGSCRRI